MSIATGIRYKIFDNGVVCPGGMLYTFESGTTTPKPVYTDATLTTEHTNPVIMDSEGEAVIFLGTGAYTFREHDALGVQIKAPVNGITSEQGSSSTTNGLATNVNVRMSTTGTSAIISISADRLALMNSAGDVLIAEDVVTSINCAAVGAGGLDTGSLAANTCYSIYAIANEVDGVLSSVSACISASEFAPTVTGYDYSVRLNSTITDGSSNKYPLAGTYEGARFSYKVVTGSNVAALPVVATGASDNISTPTYTSVAWAPFAPPTASLLHLALRSSNHSAIAAPNNSYGAIGSTTNPPPFLVSNTGVNALYFDLVPESENVYYAGDGSTCRLFCLGWTDGLSYSSGELAADEARLRSDLAAASGANLSGFSHAATYTAGTVGDRLKKVVYVTDAPYLADGTNTGDQSGAIQQAIDAAEAIAATYGGCDVVLTGKLRITSGLRVARGGVNLVFANGAQLVPVGSFDTIRVEHDTAATWMYRNKIVNGLLDETGKTGGRTLVARYVADANFDLESAGGYDGLLIDTFNTVDLRARLTNYTSATCDYVRAQGGASGQARSDTLRIKSLVMGGNYVNGQDGLVIDGFVHTVVGTHVFAVNIGGRPIHCLNSVGASDVPTFITMLDYEADYCKLATYFETGQVAELASSTMNGSRADHGVIVGSGWTDMRINGGRYTGCALSGILIGNSGTIIKGAKISANSSNEFTGTLNTYPGILIGGGSSGAIITGCRSGDASTSTYQRCGVQIDTGATNFIITDNDFRHNATAGLINGSTATDGKIFNNIGYTGTISAFVAGASPYTYRAGPSPEMVVVYGGTVSAIAVGGVTIYTSTDKTVPLGPNQDVVITHSSAPNILKRPM